MVSGAGMSKSYQKRQRSAALSVLLCMLGVGVVLSAFWDNMHAFVSPSTLVDSDPQQVHLGGFVVEGSLVRDLVNQFDVADQGNAVTVVFEGSLPTLVRESHEVVVLGKWDGKQVVASRVYAKHDQNYRAK